MRLVDTALIHNNIMNIQGKMGSPCEIQITPSVFSRAGNQRVFRSFYKTIVDNAYLLSLHCEDEMDEPFTEQFRKELNGYKEDEIKPDRSGKGGLPKYRIIERKNGKILKVTDSIISLEKKLLDESLDDTVLTDSGQPIRVFEIKAILDKLMTEISGFLAEIAKLIGQNAPQDSPAINFVNEDTLDLAARNAFPDGIPADLLVKSPESR